MFHGPSLTSHTATLSRQTNGVDIEGQVSRSYEFVGTFHGGFGSASASAQRFAGTNGQRIDAAISTESRIDVQVNDKLTVDGREWLVVAVQPTALTQRILLAVWGAR